MKSHAFVASFFLVYIFQVEQARAIYEKFVLCHIDAKNWIRYAKFELQHGEVRESL